MIHPTAPAIHHHHHNRRHLHQVPAHRLRPPAIRTQSRTIRIVSARRLEPEEDWACGCEDGSEGANYQNPNLAGNYGCPPNKYNPGDGSDCCVCVAQPNCSENCTWDPFYCRCIDLVGNECGSGSGSDGGGGDPNSDPATYKWDCVDYYWVHFKSYDGGQSWQYADDEQYAGCFYVY